MEVLIGSFNHPLEENIERIEIRLVGYQQRRYSNPIFLRFRYSVA